MLRGRSSAVAAVPHADARSAVVSPLRAKHSPFKRRRESVSPTPVVASRDIALEPLTPAAALAAVRANGTYSGHKHPRPQRRLLLEDPVVDGSEVCQVCFDGDSVRSACGSVVVWACGC
jgi:hypothetical protein